MPMTLFPIMLLALMQSPAPAAPAEPEAAAEAAAAARPARVEIAGWLVNDVPDGCSVTRMEEDGGYLTINLVDDGTALEWWLGDAAFRTVEINRNYTLELRTDDMSDGFFIDTAQGHAYSRWGGSMRFTVSDTDAILHLFDRPTVIVEVEGTRPVTRTITGLREALGASGECANETPALLQNPAIVSDENMGEAGDVEAAETAGDARTEQAWVVDPELAGDYFVRGVMETAGGFQLLPDGVARFYLSVGGLDLMQPGSWTSDGTHVRFDFPLIEGVDPNNQLPGTVRLLIGPDTLTPIDGSPGIYVRNPGNPDRNSTEPGSAGSDPVKAAPKRTR